ncbi:CRISPR-associated CARF protein Csa3 [Sulfolobus tengchongensis]|uniref:CRISPR-associated CARF protein Csa3 n=1 Tax=Sulfolobus tengchongensis TaxID=207809 RepID=A0AAX4L2E5_9CREN
MKSYFVTLGFNETYLLRLLNETSAQKEDKLVIVVPSPIVSGTRTAIENVKIQSYRLHYPEPEVHEIKLSDFNTTLSQILDYLLPLPEPIISDLTIGMRMFNSLILINILISKKKFTVYLRDEGGGSTVISFNDNAINALLRDYTKEEMRMLDVIKRNNGISTTELAKVLGKSEKTLLNKITELKKIGIVTQKGKDRKVEITPLGENAMKLIEKKLTSSVSNLQKCGQKASPF